MCTPVAYGPLLRAPIHYPHHAQTLVYIICFPLEANALATFSDFILFQFQRLNARTL